jgi:DNA-binding response OmpR family regulator
MIVDDEPAILNQIKTFLAQEDIECVTVLNSRQALEHLREENKETFDLILVNTPMPGREHSTALFSVKPQIKKQPQGIESFLQKPFTKQQFLDFVREQLETDS